MPESIQSISVVMQAGRLTQTDEIWASMVAERESSRTISAATIAKSFPATRWLKRIAGNDLILIDKEIPELRAVLVIAESPQTLPQDFFTRKPFLLKDCTPAFREMIYGIFPVKKHTEDSNPAMRVVLSYQVDISLNGRTYSARSVEGYSPDKDTVKQEAAFMQEHSWVIPKPSADDSVNTSNTAFRGLATYTFRLGSSQSSASLGNRALESYSLFFEESEAKARDVASSLVTKLERGMLIGAPPSGQLADFAPSASNFLSSIALPRFKELGYQSKDALEFDLPQAVFRLKPRIAFDIYMIGEGSKAGTVNRFVWPY